MEGAALLKAIDSLDGELDNLEDVLKPILDDSLQGTTRKLPILDRAKLNVTVVYAIESLLFSYLKLNGIDPKEHAVWKELARAKSYFAKVKEAEEKHIKPTLTLDKQAAARLIQHSLAGNGSTDMTQRAQELKARILAKKNGKLPTTNSPPVPLSTPPPLQPAQEAQAAELLDSICKDIEMEDQEGSEEGEIDEGPQPVLPPQTQPQMNNISFPSSNKKRKHAEGQQSKLSLERKAEKKARKKAKKEAKAPP